MTCQCGRNSTPRHCPACGSTNSYAKTSNNDYIVGGDSKEVIIHTGFRCRRCGVNWNTGMECEAPQVVTEASKEAADKTKQSELVQSKITQAGGVSSYLDEIFKLPEEGKEDE